MKRAILLQPSSISNLNLKVLKRPKTIKDNICGFKKIALYAMVSFPWQTFSEEI